MFDLLGKVDPDTWRALFELPASGEIEEYTLYAMARASFEHTLPIERGGGKPLMPKTSIGEGGFIASFTDCEGNRVALHAYT